MLFPSIRLKRAARLHFGWPRLRKTQLLAMRALVAKRDALVVLPTGGGKSAIYQVPAMLLEGPVVVVSPLLALQQDQIANLDDRGHRAVRISSAETPGQQEQAMHALRTGKARFLFITPEQLSRDDRRAQVKALKPALVAIDEAHCISTWGHDFRPDYLLLGKFIRDIGRPPIVALTATASPPMREDIIARLGLSKPRVLVSGLDRPNLFLEVGHSPTEDVRWRRLIALLQEDPGPGIVYVPTRKRAEELAKRLKAAGYKAAHYHGGMASSTREKRHEEFLDGRLPVMVATSAFGMGIDKPDIRWVAHLALPDSPDAYLQEIGRAGRDGGAARALLLWAVADTALTKFFAGGKPDLHELERIATALHVGPVTGTKRLDQMVALLEDVNWSALRPAQAAKAAMAEAGRRQALQNSRIEMILGFAQTRSCRTKMVLAYFGEHMAANNCGHCDNCVGVTAPVELDEEHPFPVHSTVRHAEWGSGLVLSYQDGRMTVLFDEVGYKTLSVNVVQANGLLTH
jgi:ATP-dependent DNA helicase RecQ